MIIRDLNQIKSIIVTMVLVLYGVSNVFSQNFVVGEFKYTVLSNSIADKSDKSIWVTGHIDGAETKGHINIPETVVWEGELYPVTGIWSAFLGCSGLTSVRIPTSVKTINDYSFAGCSGLTSVTIPNSVKFIGGFAFDGCTKLISVDIPSSVTYIGGYAFANCTSLSHITMSNSEINVYYNAFENTKWYNEQPDGLLYLNNCCLGYKGDKPCGNLHFKDGTRQIAAYAFSECSNLTGALVIPNSVISIGSGAFSRCNGFNGLLTLSTSLHEIGDGAFENCSGFIGDLILPESLMIIGDQAFENCSGFTGTLNIPNKVSKIGAFAFGGCRGFNENLVIGNSVTYIGSSAFADCVGFKGDLIIPKSVSFIDVCAFKNCSGLNGELVIEDPNTKMEGDVFSGCMNLTKRSTVKRYTYSGEFKMNGFGFDGTESVNSIAAYEFYNAPDETRIFDGVFCFGSKGSFNWTAFEHNQDLLAENITFEDVKKIYDEFDGMCLALGRFSQDKQVGKWIWISKYQGSRSIQVCTINFNDKGAPEGDFEIYHLYKANFEQRNGHYKYPEFHKRSYISGTIIDGVIVSIDYKEGYNTQISCNGEISYISKLSGRYNREGYPIGQWTFSGSDYTDYGSNIMVVFDDEGKCIKNYRTDPTTGDKIGLSSIMQAKPIRVANEAIKYISNRFVRSTNTEWPQINIRRYEYNW